ncbi:MAG: hypothetical protein EPN26_11170 [Rhodospirillales bacterium]|nr:MAG: hypothetical protein EPN26_11170 [Rhodospirillales bacterium]
MDRNRIILIGIVAAVILVGGTVLLGLRKPKGPDCSPIIKAQVSGRPVAALAPLLGDDPKASNAEAVAKALSTLVDVARVAGPIPDFAAQAVPVAVVKAEEAAQTWLDCGASSVIWGTVEKEGEIVIEDKKAKKPVTKPVFTTLLWVTSGKDMTVQIPRSRDGREAAEVVFRAHAQRERARNQMAAPETSAPEQPVPAPGGNPSAQEKSP